MIGRPLKHLLIQSFFLISVSLMASHTVASDKSISIAFNENWPPFSYRNENNEMTGILVDIMREVFETKLKQPIVFHGYPWKRVQHNVEIGISDGFVTTATEARLAYAIRSQQAVYTLEEKAFISNTSKHKQALSELTPQTVDLLRNYKVCDMTGNGWAETFYTSKNIDVKYFRNINLCFRNVAYNRYDVVIHAAAAALSQLKKDGLSDKVEMLPGVFDEVPFPLLISKKSKHLDIIPEFDKAMKAFKEEGGIQRIVDRHTR